MSVSLPVRRTAPRASALTLPILLASYLMIVLDVSIVITALPEIRSDLHFSSTGLSWVQNAYTLTFGGLLLLGARAGDLLGRRLMFSVGIGVFTVASLAAGVSDSAAWLLGARAVQGAGAAIAAPSTLALLMASFRDGPERTRAIAAYAAVAGAGGSVGLVLGGVLTSWVSWRVGLFLNVPIGLALLWLAPRHLVESEQAQGRFDLAGAASSTLGMTALVYGFVRAAADGWGERGTVSAFVSGLVLLVAFGVTERRAEQPITPLRLFASRERSGAYVARILVVGGMFSMFFFLTQFLQGVRGFSAIEAGVAFLPMTLVMFSMTRVVPRLAPRFGNTRLLIGGVSLALLGMAWLSRLGLGTAYFPGIAVPLVLLGVGMGVAFGPLTTAGIAGVDEHDAGAASGLVNVAHQLGGSLGLSVLVTVFAAGGRSAASSPIAAAGSARESAYVLAESVGTALTGSVVFLALALAVAVLVIRRPSGHGRLRLTLPGGRFAVATVGVAPVGEGAVAVRGPERSAAVVAAPERDAAVAAGPERDAAVAAGPERDAAVAAGPERDAAVAAAPEGVTAVERDAVVRRRYADGGAERGPEGRTFLLRGDDPGATSARARFEHAIAAEIAAMTQAPDRAVATSRGRRFARARVAPRTGSCTGC